MVQLFSKGFKFKCNGREQFRKQHFALNLHIKLLNFNNSFNMSKAFLLCITLIILIWLLICVVHVEEIGAINVILIMLSVFSLLNFVWIVTFC